MNRVPSIISYDNLEIFGNVTGFKSFFKNIYLYLNDLTATELFLCIIEKYRGSKKPTRPKDHIRDCNCIAHDNLMIARKKVRHGLSTKPQTWRYDMKKQVFM
ncbi:hypothetical protein ACFLVS_02295 [Chloroflexota bacterium]